MWPRKPKRPLGLPERQLALTPRPTLEITLTCRRVLLYLTENTSDAPCITAVAQPELLEALTMEETAINVRVSLARRIAVRKGYIELPPQGGSRLRVKHSRSLTTDSGSHWRTLNGRQMLDIHLHVAIPDGTRLRVVTRHTTQVVPMTPELHKEEDAETGTTTFTYNG